MNAATADRNDNLEDFDDVLLSEAQAAKAGNMAVSTFREMVSAARGPTMWRSDVRRWARAQRAGESSGWRR